MARVVRKQMELMQTANNACFAPEPFSDLKKSGPTEYPMEKRKSIKKNAFIGPDIGMLSCPMMTPTISTDVTLPSWKFPTRIRPIKKPSPIVRKRASGG